MSDQIYDCPGCGKPRAAVGDGMCGPCEKTYRERERDQKYIENDPYLTAWGSLMFAMGEDGKDFFRPAHEVFREWRAGAGVFGLTSHEHLPNIDNVIAFLVKNIESSDPSIDLPAWVLKDHLRAHEEARYQFRTTGKLTPPPGHERFIPSGE